VKRTYAVTMGRLLLAALLLAFAGRANAGSEAESEALIRQALQWRAQNKPDRALPLLEQAYRTARTPRTAAHLGLVQLELGNFAAAERYLTEGLASPDHPWITKNRNTLEQQLANARTNIGELAVAGSPAGAEIWVNGSRVGQLPLATPLRLNQGRTEVQVRAPGHLTATETVTIAAGKREQRTFALAVEPGVARTPAYAGAVEPPPFVPSSPAATPAPAVTVEATPADPESRRRTMRTAAWVTGGAAVGALLFGTIEAFKVGSARDAFNNHMGTIGGISGKDCGTGFLEQSPACKPLKDDYDRAHTLTIVGFAAAGALAAGASVLYLLSSPNRGLGAEPATGARALACVPDPSGRGVACSLRF
jgi:PEGA domain-containing protein